MQKTTFKTHIDRNEKLLGVHYLHIPAAQIKKLGGKLNIRLLCSINNHETFQCGMVALGEGNAYITVNNKRMKQFGLKFMDEVRVELTVDESEFGMDVPEELIVLFEQDKEGFRRFSLLPPGKQRYIIYYVSGVKNTQKRIDRAIFLIENLKKLPEGKESFAGMLGKGR